MTHIPAPSETAMGRAHPRRAKFTERTIRLTTGLILFAYATTHLISHSFGVISVDAMKIAGTVLIDPWQSYPGLVALYGSFAVHGGLGLYALYRRRHVRIPQAEFWQLVSGLAIPILLISHATNARLNGDFNGVNLEYPNFLHSFFVVAPFTLLPTQFLLLLTVWIHGCIGLRMWLRTKVWYERAAPFLLSIATLIPTFAIVGLATAGLSIRDAIERDASFQRSLANIDENYVNPFFLSLSQLVVVLILAYVALLAVILAARPGRSSSLS